MREEFYNYRVTFPNGVGPLGGLGTGAAEGLTLKNAY